jgi:hypothetical protein
MTIGIEEWSVARGLGLVVSFPDEPDDEIARALEAEREADAELRPASPEEWDWFQEWELRDERGGRED